MEIQNRLARRAKDKAPSAIRELLKYMKIDGMISLGVIRKPKTSLGRKWKRKRPGVGQQDGS